MAVHIYIPVETQNDRSKAHRLAFKEVLKATRLLFLDSEIRHDIRRYFSSIHFGHLLEYCIGLFVASLADQPSWRFGNQPYNSMTKNHE